MSERSGIMSGAVALLRVRPRITRLFLVLVGAVLVFAGIGFVSGWRPSLTNPFGRETIDRSPPAVLRSLTDLSDYHAASAHFEVVVDLADETKFIPAALRGERTLFVGVGSVDAVVDFGKIDKNAVTVSEDRRTVSVRLPVPTLSEPKVDPEHSYVVARQKGVLDRIGGFLSGSASDDRQLYVITADRMTQAAKTDGSVLTLAERNTTGMLRGLFSAVGFTTVNVSYADAR
ncbi:MULTISPECIES: DUF4230 domain-containing protein [unclassified Frankia]|uniref:DUF4230 domain-containing protein n=1 Tax=unclassified Frankia TaxID=2632575 RepID=UPI001EF48EDC|nr:MULTISPECIES: DUF4230 domain-containing protein [unclassified Frankia]